MYPVRANLLIGSFGADLTLTCVALNTVMRRRRTANSCARSRLGWILSCGVQTPMHTIAGMHEAQANSVAVLAFTFEVQPLERSSWGAH